LLSDAQNHSALRMIDYILFEASKRVQANVILIPSVAVACTLFNAFDQKFEISLQSVALYCTQVRIERNKVSAGRLISRTIIFSAFIIVLIQTYWIYDIRIYQTHFR